MENGDLFSNQRLETLLPAKFKPVARSDNQIEPELSTCLDFDGKCQGYLEAFTYSYLPPILH